MKNLDLQLQKIQEDNIQEIDAAMIAFGGAVAVTAGTVRLIAQLVTYFLAAATMRKRIKVDKNLTKRINGILRSGNKWIVHIFPDTTPNAFAIGGKHVFVTTGLTKLLDEREIEAVMLHEVFHNKDLHLWKQFAMTNSFFYLLVFIATTAASSVGLFFLGFIIFYTMNKVVSILYNRLLGRRHEKKADEFAVKHGYGKDMASALLKMEKYIEKMRERTQCNTLCQLERKISDALDEHPPLKKRVEIVLRKSDELGSVMKSASFAKINKFVTRVFKQNG